ncbi:MAG: GTP-binding protein [Methanosarcinales archaeon]|nr:GTP-binding protein [Methanosarcinales archaeon]
MATIEEQIKEIEEEIFNTQKNKATEHHIGKLKAKIAKLRAQQELQKIKGGGTGRRYYVKKSGDATVALVGFPSVGKSSLLNYLTESKSEVGEYHFTTLEVIPGVMEHKGAKIQILDMPGIIKGAARGKGRGREVITAARAADLILLLGDVFNYRLDILERELYEAGIRLDKQPLDISISPENKGGINIRSTVPLTKMSELEMAEIIRAYGIVNAIVTVRDDVDVDGLVDFLAGNRVYIPSVVAINKFDLRYDGVEENIEKTIGRDYLELSVVKDRGVSELKDLIYDTLGFVRIYLKPKGEKADMEVPIVLLEGCTVKTVCEHLHRDFVDLFRYALVWGKSAKFPGQSVGLNHVMADGDVVSIITKRR